jgi:hypothetical protein
MNADENRGFSALTPRWGGGNVCLLPCELAPTFSRLRRAIRGDAGIVHIVPVLRRKSSQRQWYPRTSSATPDSYATLAGSELHGQPCQAGLDPPLGNVVAVMRREAQRHD